MNKIQCALCGEFLTRITIKHLKQHGIGSVDDYEKNYGPATPQKMKDQMQKVFQQHELMDIAVQNMSPADWASSLSDASVRLFSQDARNAIMNTAYAMMQVQMKLFMQSSSAMENILKEANSPWRLKMNEKGDPLSNKELLQLANIIQDSLKRDQETLLRLVNYMVTDNKQWAGKEAQSSTKAFTGEMDHSVLPVDLPPAMREHLRLLLENLDAQKPKPKLIENQNEQ